MKTMTQVTVTKKHCPDERALTDLKFPVIFPLMFSVGSSISSTVEVGMKTQTTCSG